MNWIFLRNDVANLPRKLISELIRKILFLLSTHLSLEQNIEIISWINLTTFNSDNCSLLWKEFHRNDEEMKMKVITRKNICLKKYQDFIVLIVLISSRIVCCRHHCSYNQKSIIISLFRSNVFIVFMTIMLLFISIPIEYTNDDQCNKRIMITKWKI